MNTFLLANNRLHEVTTDKFKEAFELLDKCLSTFCKLLPFASSSTHAVWASRSSTIARVRMNTVKRDRTFGNGRWARTLFEEAVSRQAVRVAKIKDPTPEQLKTLIMSDMGIKLKDPAASKED